MKVRVTVPARDDLDEIWDDKPIRKPLTPGPSPRKAGARGEFSDRLYIARDNPVAATRIVYRIRDRFEMLGRQPLLGEVCEELQPGLRSFPVRPYVIDYSVLDDEINIVRILHGARDVEQLF